MTFVATIHAAIERAAAAADAGFSLLNAMSYGALAILAAGLAGAVVGLACLFVGLRDRWRQWAQTHIYRRSRD